MNNNLVDITGNTYPHRAVLKSMGGQWIAARRCWAVPADMADEALAIVGGGCKAAPAPEVGSPEAAAPSVAWSAEQEAIFAWFRTGAGNLVVQARAGTGKTTTIKQAFSYAPEQGRLLYAVFNKKNQREAAEKITDRRVDVRTLHSLGFFFIKGVWRDAKPDDNVEFDRLNRVVDGRLPLEVAGVVLRLVGFCKNQFTTVPTVNEVLEIIDARDITVADGMELTFPDVRLAELAIGVLRDSLRRDSLGRVSFNDMVWLPVAAGWVKPTFDLVVVDEAQDMNMPQLMMAERACKVGGRICIVGDDRQAIYGFRGAVSDGMHLMKQRLNAAQLGLTITYRCPKSVVALAKAIVTDYSAAPQAPEGSVVEMPLTSAVGSLEVGDAVVSRLNAPLMGIALGLLRRGVPARIEGRDLGKQLVTMVKKLRAKSVPDFMKKLAKWGEKQTARVTAVGGPHVQSKVELIQDQVATLAAVAEDATSVDDLVSRITDLFEDSENARRDAVVCSSVHKAKGLEWGKVVLVADTFKNKDKSLEESNIYYVAVTRAKASLVWAV